MSKKNYYLERNIINTNKLYALKKELPEFMWDFFVGIEHRTSPLTRLNYAYDLKNFLYFLSKEKYDGKPIAQITVSELDALASITFEQYLSYLSSYEYNGKLQSCNEQAKKRKLSSVRSFYKYCYEKNIFDNNPASKVCLPKIHDKEIIRLEVNEVVDILNEAENGYNMSTHMKLYHENTKIRDVALLSLFLGTGIRISELVGLNVDDFDFSINGFIVTRKGGNRTVLYFSNEVAQALQEYLDERNENENIDSNEKAMFISLQNKRLGVRAVENIVKKYAKIVTPLKNITPHKLRSTYGTNLYRETGDIYLVADCLGHRDVNTTKRHYAAVSEDNRRSSANIIKLRKD